jgi:DNA-binding transcriptional ArsR family regulator
VRWITLAWDQECTNAAEKLTLIALADHAGEDGRAFPGCARLAEKTGSGERTVRRHLDQLEENGQLTRERRRRADGSLGTYMYQLVADPAATLASGQNGHDQRPTGPGSPAATGGRAEPSVPNRQSEPSALVHVEVVDEQFERFWALYRKTGPKKVAHRGWEKAIKAGATPDELIEGLQRWMAYWESPGAAKIKWPQGWFTEERWKDSPPVALPQRNISTSAQSLLDWKARNT